MKFRLLIAAAIAVGNSWLNSKLIPANCSLPAEHNRSPFDVSTRPDDRPRGILQGRVAGHVAVLQSVELEHQLSRIRRFDITKWNTLYLVGRVANVIVPIKVIFRGKLFGN